MLSESKLLPQVKRSASGAAEILHFPEQDMGALYQRIIASHRVERGFVLQIIGAHPGAGVTSIGHGLSRAAAQFGGQRVLMCDATFNGDLLRQSSLLLSGDLRELVALEGAPAGILASPLDKGCQPSAMLSNIPEYAETLRRLRLLFDFIVLDVPPSNASALGPTLVRHADAVLVVVEAEKTRGPQIASLIRMIQDNGGRVAGVLMNKRVQRIPDLVYRWL